MAIEMYDNLTETMMSSTIGKRMSDSFYRVIDDMNHRYMDRMASLNRRYHEEIVYNRRQLHELKRKRKVREELTKNARTRIFDYDVDTFVNETIDSDTLALMYRVLPNAKDEMDAAKKQISILLELDDYVDSPIMEIDNEILYDAIMSGYADENGSYDEYMSSEIGLSYDDLCKMDILKERLRGIGFKSL